MIFSISVVFLKECGKAFASDIKLSYQKGLNDLDFEHCRGSKQNQYPQFYFKFNISEKSGVHAIVPLGASV